MGAIAEASAPALLLVGVALAGIAIGLTSPTLATIASEHAGRERQGAILGVAQSAGGAARTVGPVWNGGPLHPPRPDGAILRRRRDRSAVGRGCDRPSAPRSATASDGSMAREDRADRIGRHPV